MKKLLISILISGLVLSVGCNSKNIKTVESTQDSKKVAVKNGTTKVKDESDKTGNAANNNTTSNNSSNTTNNKYSNYASGNPTPAKVEGNNILLNTSGGSQLKYSIQSVDEIYRSSIVFNIRETQTRLNNLKKYVDNKKLSLGEGFSKMAALEKKDIAELTNPEITYVSAKNSKGHEKIVEAKKILANMFSEPYSVTDAEDEFNKVVNLFKEACGDLNITSITF